jgi:5-formyltetrahydrofolate cyclo-ligase
MKKELRTQLLSQRNALPPAYIQESSAEIQRLVMGMPVFQRANTIMLYVSMGSEVCTDGMIQEFLKLGKRVAIPFLHQQYGVMEASEIRDPNHELILGKFNTRVPKPEYFRPVPPEVIDVIVIPAVAYDQQGGRLGYGGGYYDRYLQQVGPATTLIGINFACQVVETLPTLPHDMAVHYVISERGIVHPKQ